MKNAIIFIIAILIATTSLANADGFEKIHKVNMSKDQIHNAVIEWIATTFNDPSSVIKVNDRVGGQIIVNGAIAVSITNIPESDLKTICKFKSIFNIKKNKYKIVYQDFIGGDQWFIDKYPDTMFSFDKDAPHSTIMNIMNNLDISLMRLDDSLFDFVKQYRKKENW